MTPRPCTIFLRTNYGYEPETTRLLKGPAATRDGIRQLFGDTFLADKDQVTSEDSVLVYFAGHGNRREAAQNHAHYVGLLYPADVDIIAGKGVDTISCLRLSELLGDLRDLCAARHKLVILDSCHSGEVFQYDSNRSAGVNRGFRANLFREPAFQAIAAARGGQKAADADETGKHSPVTRALLDALTSGPSGTNQTLFTASELFSYIPRRIEEMGIQQDPRGGWISGEGDFYFFPKSLTPSDIPAVELAVWKTDLQRSIRTEQPPASNTTLITIASVGGLLLIALVGLVGLRRMHRPAPAAPIATLMGPAASAAEPVAHGPILCLRLVGTPCIYQAAPGIVSSASAASAASWGSRPIRATTSSFVIRTAMTKPSRSAAATWRSAATTAGTPSSISARPAPR